VAFIVSAMAWVNPMRRSLATLPRVPMVALATIVLYLVFDRTAAGLGSTRGEAGIVVCAIVLALTLGAERLVTGAPWGAMVRSLGLGRAAPRALGVTLALCALLLAYFPLHSAVTGARLQMRSDWAVLAIGMFAQGGIAEETLFRGFLYRHVREGRTFWRGATLAAVPFVAAHLSLFFTLDFAVALAALLVSVSMTFPLARLFDRAGASIWPGAILHTVVQAAIKLIEPAVPGDGVPLAMGWMVVGAVVPWIVFALPIGAATSSGTPRASSRPGSRRSPTRPSSRST
jgi:membrane protease YdiL (CAAX protease family)